jgi:preprotein translocase subunit SecG
MISFFYFLTITAFLLLSFLLCVVILLQESKSMGLGASLGGDGVNSVFGTSTADVMKKTTAYLGTIFLILCLILSSWTSVLGKAQEVQSTSSIEQVEG